MRTCLFAVAGALLLTPAARSAELTVRIDPAVYVPTGADQVVTFEVYVEPFDPALNERLDAYFVQIDAPLFGEAGRPRFVLPTLGQFDLPTRHPYVFPLPGLGPVDPAGLSDHDTVALSAVMPGTGAVNISEANYGIAKVAVLVPADAPHGFYPLQFNPQFLQMGFAGPSYPVVAVDSGFFVPEPAGAALLTPAAVWLLRRRRACVMSPSTR